MKTQNLAQGKKGFTLLFWIFFATFQTLGQGHPPFPNVDEVYKNILNNPAVYKSLKEDYKVANPKECKIEKKMIIGSGEIDSDFSTYKSDNANNINWKWPDDRAYTVFRVTTPENTEGVKFVLPLVVEYTRLQNGALTNSFHYLWWKFDAPYSVVGGKEDALFMELLMANLFKATPAMKESGRSGFPLDLDHMTLITSIEKSDEMDERKVYSNAESVTRTFAVNGDFILYNDRDNADVKAHYVGGKCLVIAEFRRDKENGKTGDWYFSSFYGGFGAGLRGENESDDKKLYRTAGTHGVEAVFQKEKVEVPIPYNSAKNKEIVKNDFKNIVIKLLDRDPEGIEVLKKYIPAGDDEILNGFVAYFEEMNQKLVSINKGLMSYFTVTVSLPENIHEGYIDISIPIERESIGGDKELKAKYKEAGMSKETINGGGGLSTTDNISLKVTLINGEVKIVSIPKRDKPIRF